MMNPFAKAFGIPDNTVWDWIHVYKACLLEEILRGRGAAGEFRELICFSRNEYRDEYYQKLGWMWFGVRMSTLDEVYDEHQTFFAHPSRFCKAEATLTIAVDDIDFDLGIISEDVTVTHQ
jgi:hypothetical protein